MKLSFEYGTENIEFDVEFRPRKTLSIEIQPPKDIKVIAPQGCTKEKVLETVKGKAKWIIKKLFYIREMEYQKRFKEYVNGESFLYMGRNYSLQLILDETIKKPSVKLYHGKIHVTTNTKDESLIKASLETWYRKRALKKIKERVDYYQQYIDEKPRNVKVKEQKKRWGSCNSKKDLMFNWRCIMASSYILDYIVVHEMCHVVHLNHSKDFWRLVEKILPDYEERKKKLKDFGIRYDL